jgi:hypothetical protein
MSKHNWRESYQTAVLESDWTKMHALIQMAECEIRERRNVLSEDHGGTPEERQALTDATNGLRCLLDDADRWRSQQSHLLGKGSLIRP